MYTINGGNDSPFGTAQGTAVWNSACYFGATGRQLAPVSGFRGLCAREISLRAPRGCGNPLVVPSARPTAVRVVVGSSSCRVWRPSGVFELSIGSVAGAYSTPSRSMLVAQLPVALSYSQP